MSSGKLKRWSVSLVLVAGAVGSSAMLGRLKAGEPPASRPYLDGAQRIDRLQAERHEVLQQLVRYAQQSVEDPKGPAELEEATLALRNAELDAAQTPAERIRIHEQIVEFLRKQESRLQLRINFDGPIEIKKTQARRLKAEIDLEKAKLAATVAPDAKAPR